MSKISKVKLNKIFANIPRATKKLSQQNNCNDCSEEMGTNFKVYSGFKYCNECYTEIINKCALCGKEEKNRNDFYHAKIEGMGLVMICVSCSSKLHNCENDKGCYSYLNNDEKNICDQCERVLCKLHIFNHECKTGEPTYLFRNVSKAHYNGSVDMAKSIKIPWLVGVELETVNGNPEIVGEKLDAKMGISHDGSLNGRNPIEIILPPASNDRLEKFIKHTTRIARNAGYKVNKTCGMHVHFDGTKYRDDARFMLRLLATYYAIEPVIFAMLPMSRRTNDYALPLRNWISEARMLELARNGKNMSMNDLEIMWYKSRNYDEVSNYKSRYRGGGHDANPSRYHGFNMHAFFTKGTIEMRYHAGTLNRTKIVNWINFHLMILNWTLNNYNQNVVDAVFFADSVDDKLKLMVRHMRFNKQIRRYVLRNIKKFNNNNLEDNS